MSMKIPILERRCERLEARLTQLEQLMLDARWTAILNGDVKLPPPLLSKEGDPPIFGIDHVGYGKFRILTPEGEEVPNIRVMGKAAAEQVARDMSAQRAMGSNADHP